MNTDDFKNSPSGRLVPTIQGCMAFVPNPLPPKLDLGALISPLEKATLALGELNGVGRTLANPHLLIRPFSRKEAVASSKIEGTVTTVHELLNFEADAEAPRVRSDTREVNNYASALEYGLGRVNTLPVSKRLMQELHSILLRGVAPDRGANFVPGEFKADQNWIGGRTIQTARFVPPPPKEAMECLDDFEKYVHSKSNVPLLIRLGLMHYQFETIHPFPDGNGRIGRLLVPLVLCEQGVLSKPLLYLSDYFERNFNSYIDLMFCVSKAGTWTGWLTFFLQGVADSAKDGVAKASALQHLRKQYAETVQAARSSALLAKIVDKLFEIPATTIPLAQNDLKISYNSAKNNINRLVELGILTAGVDAARPQWFYADKIIDISFESGPLPEPDLSPEQGELRV